MTVWTLIIGRDVTQSPLCESLWSHGLFTPLFKRPTPEGRRSAETFTQLNPFTRGLCEARRWNSLIWVCVRSWKRLVSLWNARHKKGIQPFYHPCAWRPLGNVHVLGTERLCPCSPAGFLGGHVVWFISLYCQLTNGTHQSTSTHAIGKETAPMGVHPGVGSYIVIRRESKERNGDSLIICHDFCVCLCVCFPGEFGGVGWMCSHYFQP